MYDSKLDALIRKALDLPCRTLAECIVKDKSSLAFVTHILQEFGSYAQANNVSLSVCFGYDCAIFPRVSPIDEGEHASIAININSKKRSAIYVFVSGNPIFDNEICYLDDNKVFDRKFSTGLSFKQEDIGYAGAMLRFSEGQFFLDLLVKTDDSLRYKIQYCALEINGANENYSNNEVFDSKEFVSCKQKDSLTLDLRKKKGKHLLWQNEAIMSFNGGSGGIAFLTSGGNSEYISWDQLSDVSKTTNLDELTLNSSIKCSVSVKKHITEKASRKSFNKAFEETIKEILSHNRNLQFLDNEHRRKNYRINSKEFVENVVLTFFIGIEVSSYLLCSNIAIEEASAHRFDESKYDQAEKMIYMVLLPSIAIFCACFGFFCYRSKKIRNNRARDIIAITDGDNSNVGLIGAEENDSDSDFALAPEEQHGTARVKVSSTSSTKENNGCKRSQQKEEGSVHLRSSKEGKFLLSNDDNNCSITEDDNSNVGLIGAANRKRRESDSDCIRILSLEGNQILSAKVLPKSSTKDSNDYKRLQQKEGGSADAKPSKEGNFRLSNDYGDCKVLSFS